MEKKFKNCEEAYEWLGDKGIISISDALDRREKEMEDEKAVFIREHERLHEVAKAKHEALMKVATDVALNSNFEETKSTRYEKWKIEVNDLFNEVERVKDICQDLWMDSDEFQNWLVKRPSGNWQCVNSGMKEVYSHLDSAMFWLKIILNKEGE